MDVSPVSMRKVEVFPAPFTPSKPKHCRTHIPQHQVTNAYIHATAVVNSWDHSPEKLFSQNVTIIYLFHSTIAAAENTVVAAVIVVAAVEAALAEVALQEQY